MMRLSNEHHDELGTLWQHYTAYLGVDDGEPVSALGKHISSYLTIVLVVAATQKSPDKEFPHVQNTARLLKERIFQALHSYFGRAPSADDVLQELARTGPVAEGIADLIRHDFRPAAEE